MNHVQIYKKFEMLFPSIAAKCSIWFQNGKNSIRIRLDNDSNLGKSDLIFTFIDEKHWKLETIYDFIENTLKVKN